MNSGDIILIDFPFTIPAQTKVRPAVVLTETRDKFNDIVVCAISSKIPDIVTDRDITLFIDDANFNLTGLRSNSVIKIDRIATLRKSDIITTIGKCSPNLWNLIKERFRALLI